jgi:hypothetical protein
MLYYIYTYSPTFARFKYYCTVLLISPHTYLVQSPKYGNVRFGS